MQKPLNVNTQFFNLINQANVQANQIQLNNLGLSSERVVTVNENKGNTQELVTVDLSSKDVKRKANQAEAVLAHPTINWNAVRAKTPNNPSTNTVLIYNMDTKEIMVNSVVPEHIKFWSWVDESTLGIVGANSVYHISIKNVTQKNTSVQAEKMFDREGKLSGSQGPVQIIGYSYGVNGEFASIVGLSKENNQIVGNVQLISLKMSKSQFIKGYYSSFGQCQVHDPLTTSQLFAFTEKEGINGKVTITELSKTPGKEKFKKVIDLNYPDEHGSDFPIFLTFQNELGLLFIVTKQGILFVVEVSEGALLLRSRISQSHLITGANLYQSKGIILIAKSGDLIFVEVSEQNMVNFIQNATHISNNTLVAQKLALKSGLPGSESFYAEQFNQKLQSQDFDGAANIVANSPGTILRNINTINIFRNLPKPPSGPHPILKFFFVLLEKGKLNEIESREICQLVLNQNKPQMVKKWLQENKLYISESLGDVIANFDNELALDVYQRCGSKKVMAMQARSGKLDPSLFNFPPDDLLNQLKQMISTDPDGALAFAEALCKSNKLGFSSIAEAFSSQNALNQLTSFAMKCMPDNPDMDNWQTLILELNLKSNPSIAETIFQQGTWTRFNKERIAPLCEQKGLYLRALENYQDLKNIKRILLSQGQNIPPEYMKQYIVNKLPAEHIPSVLSDILKYQRNTKLAVEISQEVHQKVGVKELVEIFETTNSYDGLFYFLGPLLEQSKDKKVYHKYIESCIKCNQMQEVEKVIQHCVGYYDPDKVLDLFLSVKLADPKPLIILCDKNNYIKEMIRYLWENQFNTYIEIYTVKVNQQNSGIVLGTLMDLGAEENYIKQLLITIGPNCHIDSLVEEFEKRNRERLLENWLEQRAAEGNNQKSIHNALAKIAIDYDKDPIKFLAENRFYDVKEIGKYAEGRDAHFAFTAYNRDPGTCDFEILELTNKNLLFRLQAQYLVQRQSKELWAQALSPENEHRSSLVEQVVSTALPESKNVEEVSTTVQAFIQANMPHELLGLLEKIVLHSNEFASYQKLQNLLIITAMTTDKSRVIDYINRLDNYDGQEIAKKALNEKVQLYEEAFVVYKKINQPLDAIKVLLNYMDSIERAAEFAEKVNVSEVWTELALTYLKREQFSDAINAFNAAQNPGYFEELIELNSKVKDYAKMLEFLQMARKKKKEMSIDNHYIYCLAKLNMLAEMEEFIKQSNNADLARTGDKLYNEGMFEAAKILFSKLKSNSKIASCLVHLGQYQQAIEYAKKANNVKTWKEIVFACVEVKEFKLAQVAGVQVVLIPDHLEEMVHFYELHDEAEECITLLEQTVTNEKSHVSIFTQLAIMYAKYKSEKLFDFIKTYFQKLNVAKLNRICKKYQHWNEVVYLHSNYKEYDNAVKVMIEHSPSCYSHDAFVSNLLKVNNSDLLYNAIAFYIEEEPMKLNELLKQISPKLDFSKVCKQIKRTGHLPLIVDWLKSVQNTNNPAVNDSLNEIYLEMEDYESLRNSILQYDSFDALALAGKIEGSDNPEFRRISALIFRKNKMYKKSIEILIQDHHYRDAIETGQESQNRDIVKKLLIFFASNGLKEFFTVTTYTCYELLSPDDVMELAWRYGLTNYAMPFMIQIMKELSSKVEHVQKKHEERERKEEEKQERDAKKPLDIGLIGQTMNNPMGLGNTPMLTQFQGQGNQFSHVNMGGSMGNLGQFSQGNQYPTSQFQGNNSGYGGHF